jgi:poly(rC)-binding protein 2/3/4
MMENTSDRSISPGSDEFSDAGKPPVTLRFITSSKEAGGIIGKKGDNVKRMREESGAKINISDASFAERIVSVSGSTSQILKAFTMIAAKFEEDMHGMGQNGSGPSQVMFRLVIPNANCGSLIGKGGNNIKELRESTGATIQVANEMLPSSTERAVTISGTADAILPCIRRLCTIAGETKQKGPVMPYQPCGGNPMMPMGMYGSRQPYSGMHSMNMMPSQRPMMKGRQGPLNDMTSYYSTQQNLLGSNYNALMRGGGGGYHGGAMAGGRFGGRPVTKELEVPNELIGTVIGRHGQKINEIRQVSHAIIKIADADQGSTTRRVTVSGPVDCVDVAVYHINAVQAKYSKN